MRTQISKFASTGVKILVLMLVLSSCVSQRKVKLLQEKSMKGTYEFQSKKANVYNYKLQPGDNLYIKVYSVDPQTSKFFQTDFPINFTPTYLYLNSYTVDEDGYINFSFIDKLYVKGMTIESVKNDIQKALNQYFKETTVVVKLVNFQVAVLGEVNNPGNFTIDKEQVNIFQAIGMAGGIGEYGKSKKVILVRQTESGSEMHYLNLTDNSILQSEYYYLMPNDVVYVSPRGGKSGAYSTFPYQTLVTLLLVGVTAYSVLQ
ncbi:MAG: polysaccharide biosynthesis/export family protein [Bacteroidales bacterium]|nr:polysaccharide biosynthesis/export family protein [Bacteroidales bacterium]